MCAKPATCGFRPSSEDDVDAIVIRVEQIDQNKTYNQVKELVFFNLHFGTAAIIRLVILNFVAIVVVLYLMFKNKPKYLKTFQSVRKLFRVSGNF